MNRIVAISGGKDSTAMALRLQEMHPQPYEFCITPTGRELPPMLEHWDKLECLLGQKLIRVPAPTLLDLIVKYRTLPNFRMRFCTRQVKIEPFIEYAKSRSPAVCYVGIRADEVTGDSPREGTDWEGVEGVSQALPLVEWGWGIARVKDYLRQREVLIPERGDCDFCFWQTIGEWWRLWRDYPVRWCECEALEEWTGHTFRSDQRDSWPASLKGLREMFEKGFIPKGAAQLNMPIDVSTRTVMCAWCAR